MIYWDDDVHCFFQDESLNSLNKMVNHADENSNNK